MKYPNLMIAALAMIFTGIGSSAVHAQVRRYQPASPTVSPYLNLVRPEGALPNYYSQVRPQQQQRQLQQDVARFGRQQSLVNRRLEQQLGQPRAILPTGTASWFMNDGPRGYFLNSGRYYDQLELRGPIRRGRDNPSFLQ